MFEGVEDENCQISSYVMNALVVHLKHKKSLRVNLLYCFNQVTEENEPIVPFHWVEATVNVTIKEIPEEAVDKSGSIRFVNVTAEEFIVDEGDVSKFNYL